jgi:hypothetical protein
MRAFQSFAPRPTTIKARLLELPSAEILIRKRIFGRKSHQHRDRQDLVLRGNTTGTDDKQHRGSCRPTASIARFSEFLRRIIKRSRQNAIVL